VGDGRGDLGIGTRLTRRNAVRAGPAVAGGALADGPGRSASAAPSRQATPVAGATGDPAEAIVAIARGIMERQDLKAVILRVTIDGQEMVTAALGESMTGVPATTDMHFRNGAVAISYMATLLLRFVDQKALALNDPLSNWLPDLPEADRVTLRMLTNMTSGYPDFVRNTDFQQAFYADPFRQWSTEERVAIALSTPRWFAPGANWGYAHTNYLLLGQALEMAANKPLDVLLQEEVLGPMGLRNTVAWSTPEISQPVLHAFSSERKELLGIPAGTPFYEETTYWNPSWSLAQGSIQTTDIVDMTTTAEAVGEGTLLSPESHRAQIDPVLLGFGAATADCPVCRTLNRDYGFGLGVILSGAWILQNPLFGGYGAIEAYLPARRIAIAVATTFGEGSFDDQGNNHAARASWEIFAAIGAMLAPEDAPVATRR
jgi:CubicO group peptidase (beta-lactamase class C family)